MANAGQAILTIGGTIVGSFFGNPQLGYLLGSLAGQALFPTDLGTVEGPRLNDLSIQTSTIGAPVADVYGTFAISGNLIWSSGIIERVTRRKQGGKGGPTQTTKEYFYSVNCAVGICEGVIGGVKRVWADSKLIYDTRPRFEDEDLLAYLGRLDANARFLARMEIYTGTEFQEPDPTIESFEGVGNISAYRGLAYMVFNEFQLADYGNRIPNFRFEVTRVPVPQPLWDVSKGVYFGIEYDFAFEAYTGNGEVHGATLLLHTSPVTNFPLMEVVVMVSQGTLVPAVRKAIRMRATGDFVTRETQITDLEPFGSLPLTGAYDFPNFVDQTKFPGGVAYGQLGLKLFVVRSTDHVLHEYRLEVAYDIGTAVNDGNQNTMDITGPTGIAFSPDGLHLVVAGTLTSNAQAGLHYWALNTAWTITDLDSNPDYEIQISTIPQAPGAVNPPSASNPSGVSFSPDGLNMFVSFGSNNGHVRWYTLTTPFLLSTATYQSYLNVSADANEPKSIHFHPDGHKFWVVSNEEKKVREYYLVDPTPPTTITLGEIVQDVCLKCGLDATQVDVSDLTEQVDGYVRGRVMSGRDTIAPLRMFGWFDCVESVGVLKWPTRGKAAVATLTEDDLCAHLSQDARPPAVSTTRMQEVELPRRLRVHYAQTAMNYEPGEQPASRMSAGNVEVQDIEVPVAMSDQKAAQIAEVLLYDAWVSRNKHSAAVCYEQLLLEPADAITIPIDGRQERIRLLNIDNSVAGVLTLEAVRDDDGAYQSYAVGSAPAYSGTGGGTIATPGVATMVLLDLPLLRDEDNNAGYYAVAYGEGGTSFSGAGIYRSPDGGATFDAVATTNVPGIVGTLAVALPPAPAGVIDEGNELLIDGLSDDALESISEASLLAGLNAAVIGADGRWEVIQFRDAVQTNSPPQWSLTGLLRGRRGTEWAIGESVMGDTFVLLDAALMRVPMNTVGIGVERVHRVVLVGDAVEDSPDVLFTGRGVALEPFSPTDVQGTRPAGTDLNLTWVRRGRIGQELTPGVDIPLSEETEAYEVDIMDGVTVARTLTSVVPSLTYTEAQQIEDFGSAQALVTVRVYQLSAVVGRGYPSEAIV